MTLEGQQESGEAGSFLHCGSVRPRVGLGKEGSGGTGGEKSGGRGEARRGDAGRPPGLLGRFSPRLGGEHASSSLDLLRGKGRSSQRKTTEVPDRLPPGRLWKQGLWAGQLERRFGDGLPWYVKNFSCLDSWQTF